jgi:GH24 family phage-related lysozyme (muramidase)
MTFRSSPALIAHIKLSEGLCWTPACRGTRIGDERNRNISSNQVAAYYDPIGVLTIGYGTTRSVLPSLNASTVITKQEAEQLIYRGLIPFEDAVNRAVKVPITQGMFDAIVDLAYGVGPGPMASSTLVRKLNMRDYTGAANEFSRWVYADGKILPGLVTRRERDKAMFLRDGIPNGTTPRPSPQAPVSPSSPLAPPVTRPADVPATSPLPDTQTPSISQSSPTVPNTTGGADLPLASVNFSTLFSNAVDAAQTASNAVQTKTGLAPLEWLIIIAGVGSLAWVILSD